MKSLKIKYTKGLPKAPGFYLVYRVGLLMAQPVLAEVRKNSIKGCIELTTNTDIVDITFYKDEESEFLHSQKLIGVMG